MYRNIKLILVICPVFLCFFNPTILLGKDVYPGKWWRIPRLAEYLALSEEEKAKLDNMFVENRRTLIDLKSALEKEQFELDNLLDKQSFDEDAIMKQFKKLEKAQSSLTHERFRFLLKVRNILGHERFNRLKATFKEYRERKLQGQKPPFREFQERIPQGQNRIHQEQNRIHIPGRR
ncbi:MAG: periplasmic heavy metal sensor [Thermodesulfobacteriota bacterium]|nr:periplasmic heavy metal sensor [Thermodesulfobacteriota bacterium]